MFRWARRYFNDDKKWPAPSAGAGKHAVSEFLCWFVEHEDDPVGTRGCVTDLPPDMLKPAANQAYGSKSSFWQQMKKPKI